MTVLKKLLGAFFLIAGVTKIVPLLGYGYGFGGTVWFVDSMGYPMASTLVILAIIAEIAGGVALLAPRFMDLCVLRQRLAAYGLAVFTVIATVMFHVPGVAGETFVPELTQVMKNIIIIAALYAVGRSIKQTA